jgi:hypothetical protein
MPPSYPKDMIGRRAEWSRLAEFAASGQAHATLGIVWGRRRVGKSFLLGSLVAECGGFYYEAVRGSSGEALRDMGAKLGAFSGSAAPLALESWEAAVDALLALGRERETVVVLDEYPYLLEHSPELDSIIQRAFGPRSPARAGSRARLVLCGSAISIMSHLLSGTAPLHGRAGMDLRVSPFDFRVARDLHGMANLSTAYRTYCVIGGVAAYGREMVEDDLPRGARDFDRWVCRRVLSPGAPLFNEVALLLSEDPATAKARKINLYHATLAGVALGNHAHSRLTRYVKLPGASLAPIVEALVSAELIERVQDPIRENRPFYYPADPLIRFHYALIRHNHTRLARHGANTRQLWRDLRATFDAQVAGPTFEASARFWTAHFAAADVLGAPPHHVGPTIVQLPDGAERQLDVVVAAADSAVPSERTVVAIGEAKVRERIGEGHLRRLELARASLGARAERARFLLFGTAFAPGLLAVAGGRRDVELVDLRRLYGEG